jgi:hypothetical protein
MKKETCYTFSSKDEQLSFTYPIEPIIGYVKFKIKNKDIKCKDGIVIITLISDNSTPIEKIEEPLSKFIVAPSYFIKDINELHKKEPLSINIQVTHSDNCDNILFELSR